MLAYFAQKKLEKRQSRRAITSILFIFRQFVSIVLQQRHKFWASCVYVCARVCVCGYWIVLIYLCFNVLLILLVFASAHVVFGAVYQMGYVLIEIHQFVFTDGVGLCLIVSV